MGVLVGKDIFKIKGIVQCHSSWEILKPWGQERDWKLEFRDPGPWPQGFCQCRKQNCFKMHPGFW